MQKILRYAYDIVLFTIYSYFSFVEAVNKLGANIDCTIKLKWHFNYTHLSSTILPMHTKINYFY